MSVLDSVPEAQETKKYINLFSFGVLVLYFECWVDSIPMFSVNNSPAYVSMCLMSKCIVNPTGWDSVKIKQILLVAKNCCQICLPFVFP